jgi:serine/threonine protein kinase
LFKKLNKINEVEVPEYYLIRNVKDFGEAYDNIASNAKLMCFEPNHINVKKLLKIVKPEIKLIDNLYNEIKNEVQLYDTYKALSVKENFEFIAMEYLEGEEYILDCISRDGKLLASVLRKTVSDELTILEKDKEFKSIAERISEELNMNYVYSIKFIKNQDKIKITNVVPYMTDGIQITSMCGINFPYVAVKLAMNRKIIIPEPYERVKVAKIEKYIRIK